MISKKNNTEPLALENSAKVKESLDELIVKLNSVPVPHSAYVWLYIWDLICEICSGNQTYTEIFAMKKGVDIEMIWNKLYETWNEPPLNEPTLEYGFPSLDEQVIDWLLDNEFIIDTQEAENEQQLSFNIVWNFGNPPYLFHKEKMDFRKRVRGFWTYMVGLYENVVLDLVGYLCCHKRTCGCIYLGAPNS